MRTAWRLLKDIYDGFTGDSIMRLSAALAFYTSLSLAPLVLIVLALLGSLYGADAAREALLTHIRNLIGAEGGKVIRTVVRQGNLVHGSGPAALIGAGALLFAATTVFAQLQDALNVIWHVRPAPERSDVLRFLRKRVLSLGMILGVAFLMLVSLVASAAVSFLVSRGRQLNVDASPLLPLIDAGASLVIFTSVFAVIFKWLPDVRVRWRRVWLGAAVTAVLFAAGKEMIGFYLGRGGVGSAYGAAGSLFVVLLWTYYSSMIVLVGAEFTRVWTLWRDGTVPPSPHAVSADPATVRRRG